jgi:carboxymethylenebutenolidase
LPHVPRLDPAIRVTADLFAEEGYVVRPPDLGPMDVSVPLERSRGLEAVHRAATALRARPECTGKLGVLGFGNGGLLAFLAAALLPFDAAVVFDSEGLEGRAEPLHVCCPSGLHLGVRERAHAADHLAAFRHEQVRGGRGDASIFTYARAGGGLYLRGRPGHDRPSAQVAHSRMIGLLRRSLGRAYDVEALWEQHFAYEFERKDPEGTMRTMTAEPVKINVPVMTGGVGQRGVLRCSREEFLGQMPADCHVVPVSRTVGTDRVVDEHLLGFTRELVMDAMLPGVPPTGRAVELAVVAIVEFRGDKVAREHIHWDQASLLAQVGVLDAAALGLPIGGAENTRRLLDERVLPDAKELRLPPR